MSVQDDEQLERATRIFLAERGRLLHTARRILKDHAAAEDAVQDVWLRWQRVDHAAILNPGAFLMTATTHVAINIIQSARCRHERPTDSLGGGPLGRPEDSAGETGALNTLAIEQTLAFLMAKLTPSELATYVLRKSFDYPYDDIAELLGVSTGSARQLVRRGQLALNGSRVRGVDRAELRQLVQAFNAATEGELADLERILVGAVSVCGRRQHVPACDAVRSRALGRSPVQPGRLHPRAGRVTNGAAARST